MRALRIKFLAAAFFSSLLAISATPSWGGSININSGPYPPTVTPNWSAPASVRTFGNTALLFGQSFTTPSGSNLLFNNITVYMSSVYATPYTRQFQLAIAPFSDTNPPNCYPFVTPGCLPGNVNSYTPIYTSGLITPPSSVSNNFTAVTINTGGVALSPNSQYIAIFSNLNSANPGGTYGAGFAAVPGSQYAGGNYYYRNNATGLETAGWTNTAFDPLGGGADIYFDMAISN